MKRKIIILVLVIMLLLSQGLYLNAQENVLCFVSGNNYLEILTEHDRLMYVAGLIDMLWYILSNSWPEAFKLHEARMENMSMEQIMKIFDKYLEAHPEELNYSAADGFYSAMVEFVTVK